ncbi:hypothetical protein GCM10011352_29910 [Marinobacterium zhoushanense]|uniref:Anti-sigma factor antagonist n=1 Tax=Marinobacterium zhoushanense TaxID=1679163 RepID=A0ABQ1KNW0_9GAMM|nr:STAS domain-containing protein [Marinobacterium zhoushanense]GGC01768.1 hypothetical protein GCM10011352_29910 [Marinobacterium zhoushanense]
MNIDGEELESGVLKINLSGRMDIEGVQQIEARFGELTGGEHSGVIVDMAEVPYMSSIGIRSLLINAKAVSRRGGKYVVLNPQPDVKSVLEISGIDKIMDVCMDYGLALGKVSQ